VTASRLPSDEQRPLERAQELGLHFEHAVQGRLDAERPGEAVPRPLRDRRDHRGDRHAGVVVHLALAGQVHRLQGVEQSIGPSQQLAQAAHVLVAAPDRLLGAEGLRPDVRESPSHGELLSSRESC
jgi:hypothetical protein